MGVQRLRCHHVSREPPERAVLLLHTTGAAVFLHLLFLAKAPVHNRHTPLGARDGHNNFFPSLFPSLFLRRTIVVFGSKRDQSVNSKNSSRGVVLLPVQQV